jgi:ABC-2 type transport system ATP-binding protein
VSVIEVKDGTIPRPASAVGQAGVCASPLFEAKDISVAFGGIRAVDGVSFDVKEGEVFGFLGANGAGKSTTIRMLCGLLRPTSGTATVGGVDVGRNPEGVKARIGYMSQRFSLYEALTVDQNIRFFAGIYDIEGARYQERRRFVLEMAGLKGREDTKRFATVVLCSPS